LGKKIKSRLKSNFQVVEFQLFIIFSFKSRLKFV